MPDTTTNDPGNTRPGSAAAACYPAAQESMTAPEIVDRLSAGEEVVIPASMAGTFMRECDRHGIKCYVSVEFNAGQATLRAG